MTLKIWRGDAPAVAQQTRITPSGVEIGDVFTLTINGKSISVTATSATAASVCSLLAAAIATAAGSIQEFGEFTVTNAGSSLLLTASTAGVPFVITGSTTNGSVLGVNVATTTAGAEPGAAVNMTQTFRIPLSADGDFTVIIGGATSTALAHNASAATVEAAIESLSTIGSGNVSVSKTTDANDSIFVMTFRGALAAATVATAIVSLGSAKPIIRTTQQGAASGAVQNEIQTIDTGDYSGAELFTLTYSGQTTTNIAASASAATLESQLEALSNITSVTVTKSGQVFTVQFNGSDGNANQSQMTASSYDAGYAVHSIAVSTTPPSGSSSGTNEVQTITLTGSPTGGTFTLTFNGQTTAPIAYNASAATVDSALEALSNIGSGDVSVTGSSGGPWTIDFGAGAFEYTNVPQITGDGSSLTGGSGQAILVSTEVASAGPNHWDTAANWLPSGVPANGDDVRFELGNVDCLYGLNQSAVTLDSLHVSMRYSGQIGLPRLNGDYLEYRPTELAIGATEILIGHGDGSGPSKVAINTGSVQTSVEVRDSGGSAESGISAITWRGTHSSNLIQIFGGEVGFCPYSDQSANVNILIHRGGELDAKHTAFLTSVLFTSSANFFDCTLDGAPLESY
jgi:hypothetical protein